MVVEIALAQDELAQTPLDGEDVGEDACDGEGDLHTGEVERAGSGRGCTLRRGEQGPRLAVGDDGTHLEGSVDERVGRLVAGVATFAIKGGDGVERPPVVGTPDDATSALSLAVLDGPLLVPERRRRRRVE